MKTTIVWITILLTLVIAAAKKTETKKNENVITYGLAIDSAVGTVIGQPLDNYINDPDGDVMTFELVKVTPANNDLFAVSNNSGEVTLLKEIPDDTKVLQYTLIVSVSDGKDGGKTNITTVVNIFSGTCEVCSMIVQEVHRAFDARFDSVYGNDLSMKNMFKNTNITQVVIDICEQKTSLLNSGRYYSDCKKIMKHWKFVAGAFAGKEMQPNFGKVNTKKTYIRQLNLCNATFGLCNNRVDFSVHKNIRKSPCKKCLAVAQDLYDENTRWNYKNSVELSLKSGKNPSAMTLNEIRYELKTFGKQLNGLRPDLIKRLIDARISNFGTKQNGKAKKKLMDRGKLSTLLENYCISIPMRHPPTIASIMENKCDELLDEYESEILDLLLSFVDKGGDYKSAGRNFANKLCGMKISDDCSKRHLKDKENWWRSPWYVKDHSYVDEL
jgi:hypothetical protein